MTRKLMISAKLHVLFVVSAILLFGAATASAQTGPFSFFAITPCRVVDTRGGPALGVGVQRNFAIRNNCGVPAGAAAGSLNGTAGNGTTSSFPTSLAAGPPRPRVPSVKFTQNDPSP